MNTFRIALLISLSLSSFLLKAQHNKKNTIIPFQDSMKDIKTCIPISLKKIEHGAVNIDSLFRLVYKLPKNYELKQSKIWYSRYRQDGVDGMTFFLKDGTMTTKKFLRASFVVTRSVKIILWNIEIGPKNATLSKKTDAILTISNHHLVPPKPKWIDISTFKEFKENPALQECDVLSMRICGETEKGEYLYEETRTGPYFNRWIFPCSLKNVVFELEVIGKDDAIPINTPSVHLDRL